MSNNQDDNISLEQQKKSQDHVSEWLKKSFLNEVHITVPQSQTLNAKQIRRNSTSNVRLIMDEPIVEINLTRQFYLKKQSMENNNNNNNKLNDTFPYLKMSKSHTNIPTDTDMAYH